MIRKHVSRRDEVRSGRGDRSLPMVQALEGRVLMSASPVDLNTAGLTPTFAGSTLATGVISGARVKGAVSLTITDGGTVKDTGIDTFALYASPDGLVDDGTLITSVKHGYTVKPGKSFHLVIPVKSLALPAGTYKLVVDATTSNDVVNTTTSGPSITVAAPFIDLAASVGAVKPATLKLGHVGSFLVTLTNSGNINSTGKIAVVVGLSTDGVNLAGTLTTETKSATVGDKGKAATIGISFKVPTDITDGVYYPYVSLTQGDQTITAVGTTPFTVTG